MDRVYLPMEDLFYPVKAPKPEGGGSVGKSRLFIDEKGRDSDSFSPSGMLYVNLLLI